MSLTIILTEDENPGRKKYKIEYSDNRNWLYTNQPEEILSVLKKESETASIQLEYTIIRKGKLISERSQKELALMLVDGLTIY